MELFKLFGSIVVDNDKANASIHKTEQTASNSSNAMSKAFKRLGGAIIAGFSVQKIKEFATECVNAYKVQNEAEIKLETIMKQRMNATDDSIQSIKNLASAQQELGVVGDEVQLMGAQQLATFLDTDDALKTLIPAMNNLGVQQKGVNVSGQDMVNIGNLMGKVMQGNVGALTRVGVTFTEAQEEVLKYGNESERAAMLAQVITDNVGNMNAELAKTDDGKQQQVKNTLGDMQEVIGKQLIPVQTAYYKVVLQLANFASSYVIPAIQNIIKLAENIGKYLKEHPQLVKVLEIAIGALVGIVIALGVQTGIAKAKAVAFTQAQAVLNAVLNANPIGLVVTAIGALVGAFVVAYNKCDWFREMVDSAFNRIKDVAVNVFNAVKSAIIEPFQSAYNTVSGVVESIKGLFNFSWSLPKPSIPHFVVSGGKAPWGFMGKGSLPYVGIEWYAKGGIMDDPTMFGFNALSGKAMVGGEAGPEAIAPLNKLEEYYKRWSNEGNVELIRLMKELVSKLPDKQELKNLMVQALLDGSFSVVLEGREVGRIVKKYA